jgi:DNA topoisomerase-1
MVFYKPYITLEHNELPELKQREKVKNQGIKTEEKFTQPPHRYNQASLLAKMEQEQIGTKATRADIIATLFKRNYITIAKREGIEVTDLGFAVIDSMKTFVPAIVSIDLTRTMEAQLESVEQGRMDNSLVIEQAVDMLIESLSEFMEKESDIGTKIADAASYSNMVQAPVRMLGPCPICKNGQLRIIHSRTTKKRFVGCSNYANGCKASAPLPQKGNIRLSGKVCTVCSWPVIGIIFSKESKQWKVCINSQCSSKKHRNK